MTTILPSKTGNILLANYGTGNPFEIYAGTVIIAHSGVAIYGNASQVFTLSNAGNVYGYADGIALNLGGTIINSGTISSKYTALNIAGGAGFVVNAGQLTGRTTDAVAMTDGGALTNDNGATITGAFIGTAGSDAVFISGAAGTINNFGIIAQAASPGHIRNGVLLNAGGTVTNAASGTITAGSTGVEIANAVGAVVNSGSIGAKASGVALTAGGMVTNIAGLINGATGVYVKGATGTVTNGASITGAGAGVYLKAGGRVSNLGSLASISGGGDGVQIAGGSGTVQNSGGIAGVLDGVALFSGGYVNNVGAAGAITGGAVGVGVRGGAGTVSNAATITATGTAGVGVEFYDTAGTFNNTVINSGAIGDTASFQAVKFGAGDDRLVVDPGAVFTGTVDGGAGTNTLELAKGAAGGSFTGLGSTSFVNLQRVSIDAGAAWTFTGANVLATADTLTNRGALTLTGTSDFNGAVYNYGTVIGAVTVISPGAVSPFVNEAGATITSAGYAIYGSFKGWSLANAGTIDGGTDAIALISAGGVITNQGEGHISGTTDGITLVTGGAVTNQGDGIISGGVYGIRSYSPSSAATISNLGTSAVIAGGIGVDVYNATVSNAGLIEGYASTYETNGIGVLLASGTLSNSGLIKGLNGQSAGVELKSGQVTNLAGGTITGGYYGLYEEPGAVSPRTLINYGTISQTSTVSPSHLVSGVLVSGGIVNNQVGGVISGVSSGVAAYDGGSASATTLINAGTIKATSKGGVGVGWDGAAIAFNNDTLINSGTIVGGSAGKAVVFGQGNDLLVFVPGAVFKGSPFGSVVDGGAGSNTLELAAASRVGVFTGLGSSFTQFQTVNVDDGASWIFSGVNTVGTGVVLDVGGKVTNTGTIAGPVTLVGSGRLVNTAAADIKAFTGVYSGPLAAATVTNYGQINGAGGYGVQFKAAADRLIAEAGSVITGGVRGGGGVLELAGGAEVMAGMGGSAAAITGGVTMEVGGFGAYVVDAAANLEFTGANILVAGDRLIANGLTSLAAGASLTVKNGAEVEIHGAFANAGFISLAGAGAVTDLKLLAGGANLNGAGTITMNGSGARIWAVAGATTLTNLDNTIVGAGAIGAGFMTLVNDAAGTIEATGLLTVHDATGAKLTNSGLMEAVPGGILNLTAETIDQSAGGTILAAAGLVDLGGVDVIGGTLTATGGGRITVTAGNAIVDASKGAVTMGGLLQVGAARSLTMGGTVTSTGQIDLLAGKLIVAAVGLTLSGKGQVNLNNNAGNIVVGATAAATLTNVDHRIAGAGHLGNGAMVLINQAGGVILGNQGLALTIDTGASTLVNAGLIENTGKGGTLVIGAVNNTGILAAATAGTLTLAGAVTGAGVGQITGGTLYAKGAFSENVTFTGTTGVLELGASTAYGGAVNRLSKTGTDWLDLDDIAFTTGVTTATYSGTIASGTLTVTDGTHTAHIKLLGDYRGSTFTVSSDGHGGTKVVDPAAPTGTSVHAMVTAMAAFTPSPPSPAVAQAWRGETPVLLAARL